MAAKGDPASATKAATTETAAVSPSGLAVHGSIPPSASSSGSDEADCLICQAAAVCPVHLSCACHFVCCASCLLKWLQVASDSGIKRACPTCRREDVVVLTRENRELSKEKFDDATQSLARATLLEFCEGEGKEALKCALHDFINAIVADNANAPAYVGMGYICMLISNHALAYKYLRVARDMAPEKVEESTVADARKLIEHIPKEVIDEIEANEAAAAAAADARVRAAQSTPNTVVNSRCSM